jgi:RNA polymerase sigma-70 factor (ECF subfamily)
MADPQSGPSHFRTTAWSVVQGAQGVDGRSREQCLAELCTNYWKPVYYYIRRRGLNHEDALDITQEYFATFLEKDFVAAADRERGRFRTFVLVTVNRFLSKQLARQKRTHGRARVRIHADEEEQLLQLPELADDETAEDDFNRRWALSLIETALERMRAECEGGKKRLYYEAFRRYLESTKGNRPVSYRELGDRLGVSESDVTNFLHRGRNIFQKMLRDEIRNSVLTETEVDEEIEALKGYLRG